MRRRGVRRSVRQARALPEQREPPGGLSLLVGEGDARRLKVSASPTTTWATTLDRRYRYLSFVDVRLTATPLGDKVPYRVCFRTSAGGRRCLNGTRAGLQLELGGERHARGRHAEPKVGDHVHVVRGREACRVKAGARSLGRRLRRWPASAGRATLKGATGPRLARNFAADVARLPAMAGRIYVDAPQLLTVCRPRKTFTGRPTSGRPLASNRNIV
jgi:hypothetical protein